MVSSIKDLKKWYFIFLEIGLILALLIFLSAFSVQIGEQQTYEPAEEDVGIPILVDIPTTKQNKTPATPPKPYVSTSKPDDYIFDEPVIDLPNVDIKVGETLLDIGKKQMTMKKSFLYLLKRDPN